jgi:hypothetical protein
MRPSMKVPRVRFTMRWMMLAVAFLAVILGWLVIPTDPEISWRRDWERKAMVLAEEHDRRAVEVERTAARTSDASERAKLRGIAKMYRELAALDRGIAASNRDHLKHLRRPGNRP